MITDRLCSKCLSCHDKFVLKISNRKSFFCLVLNSLTDLDQD